MPPRRPPLYRYAPDRDEAKWIWLTPGSVSVTLLWLLLTLGFGFYVANFGSYDATYGSLGAVVVLLTWLYLSAYILLLGAELNSELERQTAADTTVGADRPLGERDAIAADEMGRPGEVGSVRHQRQSEQPDASAAADGAGPEEPAQIGLGKELAISRIAANAGRAAGLRKVGLTPSLLATGGLGLIGKRGRLVPGLGLVALAVAVTFLGRERPAPPDLD